MNCFITERGLSLLLRGSAAPLWRSVVCVDSALAVNALAMLVAAAAFAFAVRRLAGVRDEAAPGARGLPRLAPFIGALTFFAMPQFASALVGLNPLPITFALVLGSWALLAASVGERRSLRTRTGRLPAARLFLAGVLAALGVWEGTLGLMSFPVLLVALIRICWSGDVPVARPIRCCFLGFALSFAAEGLIAGWPLSAFRPDFSFVPALAAFVVVALLPLLLARRFGERWWLLVPWGLVLVVAVTYSLTEGRFATESAVDRMAKIAIRDLDGRKYVIGDGLMDDFIRVRAPEGVQVLSPNRTADRERMIAIFGDKEPSYYKALSVKAYYNREEMKEAMAELGKVFRPADRSPQALAKEADRRRKDAAELANSLKVVDELGRLPLDQRRLEADKARYNIRQAWKDGARGYELSTILITLDLMMEDRKSAEEDAVTALLIDADDPAANGMLGNFRLAEGRLEEAESYLRKGVKGGGIMSMNDLAELLMRTDRLQEAEGWIRKALDKSPNEWQLHNTFAELLERGGRKDEAKQERAAARRLRDVQKNELDRTRQSAPAGAAR